ncbi:MAG TPA: hypothetical protein EYH09_00520 [Candidatus Nanopusillus sp.]|nr:hypothetical protein [Candidatus Nanopusillus sp.]
MEAVVKNIPLLKKKEWAGNLLEKFKGGKGVGESWEVSTHFSGVSKVLYKKKVVPLTDFVKRFENILGFKEFPIIVKLLDIGKILSIQVHPSDEIAKELGEKDKGKSEGWIALSEGKVYLGVKDYSKEITLDNLRVFEAKPFDTFSIYPGTIHTAENIFLLEVSTPSNLTYRIYDPYGREVHIEKAKKCIKQVRIRKDRMKLKMKEFYAEVIEIDGEKSFIDERVNILIALDNVIIKSKNSLGLKKYESCIVLPWTEYVITGKGFIIRVHPNY